MQTETTTESVTLYYRQAGSDKVYQVAIEPAGTGFAVIFAFGRRGSTLTTGTKTSSPVEYDAARKIYDKLVKEKTAKGYTPGEDGTPYAQTERQNRSTGILPQLLNAIDEPEAERLIADPEWWMQEKLDGKRVLIHKCGNDVLGINRTGLVVGLPEMLVEAVRTVAAESCLLDGESVGDVYHAFDLLELDGTALRNHPYAQRYDRAMNLVDAVPSDQLRFVATASTTRAKRAMLVRFQQERKEGVVFKLRSAPYSPGRPARGGPQLKLKFTATASCIVAVVSTRKRSVALELTDGTQRIPVGNVTIPPNHPVPKRGEVVEVRYLYAYPGGSLYQPVYLGRRDDIEPIACVPAQLKLKPTEADDES